MGKLKKLTLEFEDGTVMQLAGKDAQDWKDWVDGQAVFGSVHGYGAVRFPWKTFNANHNVVEEGAPCVRS